MNEYTILLIVLFFLVTISLLGLREAKKRKEELIADIEESYGKRQKATVPKRIEIVKGYYRLHCREQKEMRCIDDITWRDLELDKLYGQLNHTRSFMGEEYLYYRLRTPFFEEEPLLKFEKDVKAVEVDSEMRKNLQMALSIADKASKYSLYDCLEQTEGKKVKTRLGVHILNYVFLLSGIILLFIQTGIGLIVLLAAVLFAIMTYFKQKSHLTEYDAALKEILRLTHAGENILNELSKQEKAFTEERDYSKEAVKTLKELTSGASKILGKDGKGSFAGIFGMDYINMIFHFDQLILERILPKLPEKRGAIDCLFENLGYIDMTISVASYRASLENYCLPVFDSKEMAKGIYHPMLQNAITNDYCFDGPVLLTGSNASGKSTFLRCVAINMLLSQTLHTAAAEEFHTGFHQIYTSMSLKDDLMAGDSYFMAEIKAMKRIMDAAEKEDNLAFFVDEVLRGTNTVERIAASTQILYELSEIVSFGIAATHDIELTELLGKSYQNYHFSEQLKEGKIQFDYILHSGKADSRNAILLLAQMGYDEKMVAKAQQQADYFLQNGHWEQESN